jgi:hypothetical protein
MGNDTRFVKSEDLPFRLVEIPTGSAPPPPPHSSHTHHKRHAPPVPPPRVDGYDAPPSLPPPPMITKRYDEPIPCVPQRSDLPQSHLTKMISQKASIQINDHHHHHHRRRISPKRKLRCCVIC